MICVHRSQPSRQLSRSPVPRSVVVAWSERGYLQPEDACSEEGTGTLQASELAWLEDAQRRGTRRRWLLRAGALASVMLAALAAGPGLPSGLAAALLLAGAHTLLMAAHDAPRQELASLPSDEGGLAAHERRRLIRQGARSLTRLAPLCAVAALAAVPGTWESLSIAAFGLASGALSKLLVL